MTDNSDPDPSDEPNFPTPFKKIRSGVRRRILDRLSEGRATVTAIGNDVGLRLPHASAELKKLRDENLITSDEETGARGAQLALSAKGWNMLRADEITRLKSLESMKPPDQALGRLISVIDNHLLVAFIRRPPEGPLAMPSQPLESIQGGVASDGSRLDWQWIEPRERRPRWLNGNDFRTVQAPSAEIDSGHLATWGADIPVWGLQRFRLIGSQSLRLGIGAWFGMPPESAQPSVPNIVPLRGTWRLGVIAEGGPEVRPISPVLGIGLDRLSRDALLMSAAADSVTVAPSGRLAIEPRPLPLDLLDAWVERAHARLRPADRVERLNDLRNALSEPDDVKLRRKIDDATWRRFRQHWGDSSWSSDLLVHGQLIDTTPLSESAESTIITWLLESINEINISLDVSPSIIDDIHRRSLPLHVRLILTNKWSNPPDAIRLEPHPVLSSMWACLTFTDGTEIPINLAASSSIVSLGEEIVWSHPTRAAEVMSAQSTLGGRIEGSLIPDLSASDSENRLMRAAVLSYPIGDEDWANRMEEKHPLVSWIASSSDGRWSRWQRIGSRLGVNWIDLMHPDDVPVSGLAKAALSAPAGWRRRLTESLQRRIRIDSELAHQIRLSGESCSPTESAWLSSILFSEIAWLPSTQQVSLSVWGIDRFLDAPPARCAGAISGIDWLAQQLPDLLQSEPDDWRPRARNIAFTLPQDHDLHLWAHLVDWLSQDVRPPFNVMRSIVERLPEEWWAPVAETALSVLSDEEVGIDFLVETNIAWPALILRPSDETHRLPGGTTTLHGGVRRTLLSRLERLIEQSQLFNDKQSGIGANMIVDLRDALRAGRTQSKPPLGRTHPRVGWLAIPQHLWPPTDHPSMSVGDARITSRLAMKQSGWHPELSRNPLEM
jgi:DNA-binding transcriptional ArsR family regulator